MPKGFHAVNPDSCSGIVQCSLFEQIDLPGSQPDNSAFLLTLELGQDDIPFSWLFWGVQIIWCRFHLASFQQSTTALHLKLIIRVQKQSQMIAGYASSIQGNRQKIPLAYTASLTNSFLLQP